MRFALCLSSIRSRPDRPGRDQVATWVDDHRRDRDATHWPWFALLSRHCHDLSLTIVTVHDQPETLHNPLVQKNQQTVPRQIRGNSEQSDNDNSGRAEINSQDTPVSINLHMIPVILS
jgi:hypothetical protein